MNIRITQDIASILFLNDTIFPGEDLDVSSNTYHWIARDGDCGSRVGFCSCTDLGQGILFLSRSGLLREYRGNNTQRRFIRVRESFARKNNFKVIITYTHRHNFSSMNNLIKHGYQHYMPEIDYAGDDFIYFIKHI
jgi:hypothetical protein